jgi:hypothetical protein
MIRIGIITTILIHDLWKYISNIEIINYVEKILLEYIENNNLKYEEITLISNGYPWIEHIPVNLYLKNENTPNSFGNIELYMPTGINSKEEQFLNTHEGRVLNSLHNKYKSITNIDSLENLTKITKYTKPQKKIIIKRGYKQANTLMVRNCDYVLVFGLTETPQEELWNKILCKKAYYKLSF